MQTLKTAQNNVGTLPLKELVDFSLGGDWGKNPDEKLKDYVKVKVVRGTEFANWWKYKANTAALRQIKKSSFEKRQLKSGDLVVEVSGGGPNQPVGRIVVIDDDVLVNSDYPLVCSNFFRQIRLKKDYVPAFVRLSIYFDYLSGKLDNYQTSSTNLRNLNFNDFLSNIEIPILPRETQELVTSKIENAIDAINLTKVKLTKARVLVKKFRQAILSAAITGKLTEDWRENKSLTTENVESSIEKINTFDIPENWLVCELGKLIKEGPQNGLYKPQSSYGQGILILRIDSFYDGTINDWVTLKRLNVSNVEAEKYALHNQDIVINRVNSLPYLGKTAIVKDLPEECVFESNIMRLVLNEFIEPDYANLYLQSFIGKEQLRKNAKHAVNQASINQEDIKSVLITLPPKKEQAEIVRLVKHYFNVAYKVEKQIEKAEAHVSKLTQAILASTFRQQ